MKINILQIFLIVIGTCFFYWANDTLNKVPFLREIIRVLIVGVGLICLLESLGITHFATSISLH